MERRFFIEDSHHDVSEGWDPNDLLHPAQAFEHPSYVVNDPDLTLNEKRAILASWASDACAPEARPAFALRSRWQGTGSVRRCDGGSAHAGQASQRKGQRAVSARVAPQPLRESPTSAFQRETLNQLGGLAVRKSVEGKIMWPDRYDISKFMMMTGFVLSCAVVLATIAK